MTVNFTYRYNYKGFEGYCDFCRKYAYNAPDYKTYSGSKTFTIIVTDDDVDDTYTVIYNDGDANGASFADQVHEGLASGADTPAFQTGTPTWTDHVFDKWSPEWKATVSGDVTYVAQWKEDKNNNGTADDLEDKYTVTYTDGVAGEVVFADDVHEDLLSGTQTPAFRGGTPTREDYVFVEWEPKVSETVGGNATYKATWKEVKDDDWDDDKWPDTVTFPVFGLDTADHIAYIYGYPDGTVRPDGTITRAEVTTIFYRLLTNARRDQIFTTKNSFKDVDSSKWYNKAASSMANGGYIEGYSDGTFGADKPITRAEFVSIAARFASKTTGRASYSDISSSHWAARAIAVCASNGWVQGYADGTFRPDQPITRAEAMTIINRMLGRGVSKGYVCKGITRYADNDSSKWYYYEVLEATNDHEYQNSRPFEQWVRASVAHDYDIEKYEKP